MDLPRPEGPAEGGPAGYDPPAEPSSERPATAQDEPLQPGDDILVDGDGQLGSEAPAGSSTPENGATSPDRDEPLDPTLVQLFVEANNEAQESVLAGELPDIPIRDLLSELVSLRQSLDMERPPAPTGAVHEDGSSPAPERLPEPERLPAPDVAQLSVAGLRRHALHGLLLSLTLTVAIASVLVSADRLAGSEVDQTPTPTPPATATVRAGVVVSQVHPRPPTTEPAPATPRPAPKRPPAYFVYTIRHGDTLSAVVTAFGLSLDHILWAEPDTIDDPNLLLAGDKILIPSDAGTIYYVKPGNVLSVLGRFLPDEGQGAPGPSR